MIIINSVSKAKDDTIFKIHETHPVVANQHNFVRGVDAVYTNEHLKIWKICHSKWIIGLVAHYDLHVYNIPKKDSGTRKREKRRVWRCLPMKYYIKLHLLRPIICSLIPFEHEMRGPSYFHRNIQINQIKWMFEATQGCLCPIWWWWYCVYACFGFCMQFLLNNNNNNIWRWF